MAKEASARVAQSALERRDMFTTMQRAVVDEDDVGWRWK
jgi:hypothetical protein